MKHDLCVADVSPDPNATDAWEARCSCGWVGPQANEDAADALARAHREIETLRAVAEYAEHRMVCRVHDNECQCGLDDAIAAHESKST